MTGGSLKFVVSVLKGDIPEKNIFFDWYEVLGFLLSHRIAGLFYSRAKKSGLDMPCRAEKILSDIFLAQERKNVFMRSELKRVAEEMIKMEIPCFFPKGSLLSNMEERHAIYSDGERVSNDIDVVVKPDGITAVSEALKTLGFIQGRYDGKTKEIIPFTRLEILTRRMNRGETSPFVKLTGNNEFPFIEADINFSLGNTPDEYRDLLDDMVAARQVYNGKAPLLTVDAEMFFIHLILHQYKECTLYFMVERGKDLDMYKLADIYYFWKSGLIDKNALREKIKKYGLEKETAEVLGQVQRVFATDMFAGFIDCGQPIKPDVIDYAGKKAYVWIKSEDERIRLFDSRSLLRDKNETDFPEADKIALKFFGKKRFTGAK